MCPCFYSYSDGLRPEVIQEPTYSWNTSTSSWTSTGTRTYVLGPLPDERLIYRAADGQIYYPHTDRRGSTVALSQAGQAVETYAYDEFGRSGSTGPSGYPYRYTGQRLDPWTGTYHYKAREYSPQLGRFLQPDPARFVDGPNLYAYVGNNPWNATDPTGLEFSSTSTVKPVGGGRTITTVRLTFTAAFRNDGGAMPTGVSEADLASQLEAQIEASFTGEEIDAAGNITRYRMDADIAVGSPTGSQHELALVAAGDARVASSTGTGQTLGRVDAIGGNFAAISDATFTSTHPNASFERTGAHEVGHLGGELRTPTTLANLMTQT